MTALTPMMRQYLDIKKEYSDCILFFRLGDFYEMFFDDAEIASQILEIVLTGRDAGLEKKVPMCGFPYHSAEGYIAKLIASGHKIAICEQVEDPRTAKGIVKREVIRVITPGTVLEANLLNEKENNFLIAISKIDDHFGFSFADISTGRLSTCEIASFETLQNEIVRLSPKEIIVHTTAYNEEFQKILQVNNVLCNINEEYFKHSTATQTICNYFGLRSLESLGLNEGTASTLAVGALLKFIEKTQRDATAVFSSIELYSPDNFMLLDSATRRNLELTHALRSFQKNHSLLSIIDFTVTAMGGRLLRNWLQQPLIDKFAILIRQEVVAELGENYFLRSEIRDLLKGVYDLERITGRVAFGNASPRDLLALKNSLQNIVALQVALLLAKSNYLKKLQMCDPLIDIKELLQLAISDTPPLSPKEEGIIKGGYNEEIDLLRIAKKEGKNWIATLENNQREATGIKSLKVGFNKVFGYYIEITHANTINVPLTYMRKQTLANAERYITPELKEIEDKILGAEEKLLLLEHEVFTVIRNEVAKNISRIQKLALAVSEADVLQSLAEAAIRNNYVKPEFIDENIIHIIGGRHPVVEISLSENFVPNDCYLNGEENTFMLLTGPNMAGKSTFMRQVALIILLAQIGSFVPAEEAKLGVVDRIFTRVGASDDLAMGQSTFMVEMIETANILRHATSKSLVILDEIGRGTSTYDGLSIAWAVAEYLLNFNGAKTIFATHYHELTELTNYHDRAANFHVAIKEKGEDIIFIRKILPGATDRSYGIHVAKLAGLPEKVMERASEILASFEKLPDNDHLNVVHSNNIKPKQLSIFESDQPLHPILTELSTINIGNITPLEALLKLNVWQKKMK